MRAISATQYREALSELHQGWPEQINRLCKAGPYRPRSIGWAEGCIKGKAIAGPFRHITVRTRR